MAAYKLTNGGAILRTADQAYIPPDPANADYREYLAWQAAGNTPDPADPAPVVYAGEQRVEAKVRTTDATAAELYRRTLAQTTGYAADLTVIGVDATNGATTTGGARMIVARATAAATPTVTVMAAATATPNTSACRSSRTSMPAA